MRNYQDISKDWRFALGDPAGAEQIEFDDQDWRMLNLPHDWSIEGNYSPDHDTDWQGGYLPAGIGWYRKVLTQNDAWTGQRVIIDFDGIYVHSDVWINGQHLGHQPNGYIGFDYHLTPYLRPDKNVIAVRVDHSRPRSGRWYTGSGIYRPVHLLTTPATYIDDSDTFFTTGECSQDSSTYEINTRLVNTTSDKRRASLQVALINDQDETVSTQNVTVDIPGRENASPSLTGTMDSPLLWSPDLPNLYTLKMDLSTDDGQHDSYITRVGFRSIEFGGDFGFKLNGKITKMKGVCDHHTAGAVGAAIPNDLLHYRLTLLKQMGCNAIRTAHNPFAPDFYRLCDELGLLVIDEALDGWETAKAEHDYGNDFDAHWKDDLTRFIKRDRNHPCVVIWSIGNEVTGATPETQNRLINLFHELDPTRPVTQGGNDPTRGMSDDGRSSQLDVIGFNGYGEEKGVLESFHRKYPNVPIVCTEAPHTYQTRGVYRTQTHWRRVAFPAPWEQNNDDTGSMGNLAKRVFPIDDLSDTELFPEEQCATYYHEGHEQPLELTKPWHPTLYYQSSYDNASVRISARQAWQRTRDFPFVAGEFRWGSFDYLGEANRWPSRCANFGIIDLCGFPKDHYYLYQSMWTDAPMVHLLPHWTHPGKEGQAIPMVAYTNCDAVELTLNGRSLGRQEYDDEQLVWHVPFEPGVLTAIGFREGKAVARNSNRTAGDPSGITLTANGDGTVTSIEVKVVDADGTMVPHAQNTIQFQLSGPIKLIGVDNGDPLDLSPYKIPQRRAFRGKCLALIQWNGNAGEASVVAESSGLQSTELTLPNPS